MKSCIMQCIKHFFFKIYLFLQFSAIAKKQMFAYPAKMLLDFTGLSLAQFAYRFKLLCIEMLLFCSVSNYVCSNPAWLPNLYILNDLCLFVSWSLILSDQPLCCWCIWRIQYLNDPNVLQIPLCNDMVMIDSSVGVHAGGGGDR